MYDKYLFLLHIFKMKTFFVVLLLLKCFYIVTPISEQEVQPEINDQFETTTATTNDKTNPIVSNEDNETLTESTEIINNTVKEEKGLVNNVLKILVYPIQKFVAIPKVNNVLKNIGTCVVNGVMEIISFYFPAPFIPLIASAAGMVIPFEPIVTLRRRMPVTSYRRALKTAVNGFMNTFDAYKFDNFDEDPYMTRRFNRRFMNADEDKEKDKKDIDVN